MKNKKKKKLSGGVRAFLIILIVIAVGALGFSIYKLTGIKQSYNEANQVYEDIEAIFTKPAKTNQAPDISASSSVVKNEFTAVGFSLAGASEDDEPESVSLKEPEKQEMEEEEEPFEKQEKAPKAPAGRHVFNNLHTSALYWDYDTMLDICEDSVGYIYQEGTLSYPVVQAEDNVKYLRHLINGKYNVAGTIFVDSRCEEGLPARYSIIYGHNMDDNSMFGSITDYAEKDYYKKHPTFEVYDGNDMYVYHVYAAGTISIEDEIFNYGPNTEEFLSILKHSRTLNDYYISPRPVTDKTHVLVLSTCIDYPRDYNYRYILVLVRGQRLLDKTLEDILPESMR